MVTVGIVRMRTLLSIHTNVCRTYATATGHVMMVVVQAAAETYSFPL
jgi:hypothetical protein